MTREEWIAERRKGIGGSDSAIIMGLKSYSEKVVIKGEERLVYPYGYLPSPYQLWLDKTGEESMEMEPNISMEVGTAMEPRILEEYETVTGCKLLPKPEMVVHKEYDWIRGSLDGWTENTIVDAKFGRKTSKWGDDGSNLVPLNYFFQLQHYMMITGYEVAQIAALLYSEYGLNFHIYTIQADKVFQDIMLERYFNFWSHVKAGIAPPPVDIEDVKRMFPKSVPLTRIQATPEVFNACEELQAIKDEIRRLDRMAKEHEFTIRAFMQDKEILTFDSVTLASCKTAKSGRRTFRLKNVEVL